MISRETVDEFKGDYVVYACPVCGDRIQHPSALRSVPYCCNVLAERVAALGAIRSWTDCN